MQSCCFANKNLFRFCHSRCSRRRRHWLSSLISDWPCLRSYMMISVERVWIVAPFERNNFCQRRVRDWDRPHYQKWRLSQHVNYGDFWETGPCSESFQVAPVWTQWMKVPHGSSWWPLCGPSEWRSLMDHPDEVTWIFLTYAVKGAKKRMFPTSL